MTQAAASVYALFNDNSLPAGSLAINGGAQYALSTAVNMTLSCSDGAGTCTQMQFSNDNSGWSSFVPYGPSSDWTLSAGDGPKDVYVRFMDDTGSLTSPAAHASITLDTTPPAGVITGVN